MRWVLEVYSSGDDSGQDGDLNEANEVRKDVEGGEVDEVGEGSEEGDVGKGGEFNEVDEVGEDGEDSEEGDVGEDKGKLGLHLQGDKQLHLCCMWHQLSRGEGQVDRVTIESWCLDCYILKAKVTSSIPGGAKSSHNPSGLLDRTVKDTAIRARSSTNIRELVRRGRRAYRDITNLGSQASSNNPT
ncbi:hypothetical protein DEO72_LG6g436 [Vigna unguiculata]|uniref:Uncharacterized protein n=1 Tax=Vigna unguiculata TaxID=3917 RepID=A0A4D6M5G4_VIGUN|nr:hypothetical protein DEO72_LG6g436 [Vigna unguiculata]